MLLRVRPGPSSLPKILQYGGRFPALNRFLTVVCALYIIQYGYTFKHVLSFIVDYALEPEAIFKWSYGKTCHGETEMGNGI